MAKSSWARGTYNPLQIWETVMRYYVAYKIVAEDIMPKRRRAA